MGQGIEFAAALVDDLKTAGLKATHDARQAIPPCVLVVPVPRREYDTLCGGYAATWTVVCLAPGPGDLTDAKLLEDMADLVSTVVPVTTVEPSAYALPTAPDPKPALLCTFQNQITPEE